MEEEAFCLASGEPEGNRVGRARAHTPARAPPTTHFLCSLQVPSQAGSPWTDGSGEIQLHKTALSSYCLQHYEKSSNTTALWRTPGFSWEKRLRTAVCRVPVGGWVLVPAGLGALPSASVLLLEAAAVKAE